MLFSGWSPETQLRDGIIKSMLTKTLRDATSLHVNGQPVFIFSGEFHYWRIPNPSLYLDIFQKIRATGFNTISIYFHWVFNLMQSPDGIYPN